MPAERIGPIDHVAVVVRSLEAAAPRYRELFGLEPGPVHRLERQRVRLCFLPTGEPPAARVELIEPTDSDSGVARFLEKRGEGLHHVCFRSDAIAEDLQALARREAELIDREPRPGAEGLVAFIHPGTLNGVLWELLERPPGRSREPLRIVGLLRAGPRWDHARTIGEQEGLADHIAYQAGLVREGRTERAGAFFEELDASLGNRLLGMVVVVGDDRGAVAPLLDADPGVRSGLVVYELLPWVT